MTALGEYGERRRRGNLNRSPDPKPYGQFPPTFDNGISLPLEGKLGDLLSANRSDEV